MKIQICDVEHGFCAIVQTDDGQTVLIDCGHNGITQTYPDHHLRSCGASRIDRLFITNYDEDHLSGLPRLRAAGTPITWLHRNRSVSGQQLANLKRQGGPLGAGVTALLAMIDTYTLDEHLVSGTAPAGFDYSVFHNRYPAFQDTNNLSLVLFVEYQGLRIVFPGDLERAGWKALLEDPAFRAQLGRVNIFVASHHGRESGYAAEVFNFCRPAVVIISDGSMQYDSQEHSYAKHASGIIWNGSDRRYVLTTRNDGHLDITSQAGSFHIQASN